MRWTDLSTATKERVEALQRAAYARSQAKGALHRPSERELTPKLLDFVFDGTLTPGSVLSQLPDDAKRKLRQIMLEKMQDAPPLEDAAAYVRLQSAGHTIEQVTREVWKQDRPPMPPVATLASGRLNAMVIRLPDTPVVFFEHGLFDFSGQMALTVTAAMIPSDSEGTKASVGMRPDLVKAKLDVDPAPLAWFISVLEAYVVNGLPEQNLHALMHRKDLTNAQRSVAESLSDALVLFVMGHEYGHVMLGHVADGKPTSILIGSERADEVLYGWMNEFLADAVGVTLTIQGMDLKRIRPALAFAGCDLFFLCAELVRRCISVLRIGSVAEESQALTGTHPPISLRRPQLRGRLETLDPRHIAEVNQFAFAVEFIVEELWTRSLPHWKQLNARGVRPAALWS